MIAARPYATKMLEVLNSLATRGGPGRSAPPPARPARRSASAWLVVTADRGLCGGFNTNILRRAAALPRGARGRGQAVSLELVGRKSVDYFKRRPTPVEDTWTGLFSHAPLRGC